MIAASAVTASTLAFGGTPVSAAATAAYTSSVLADHPAYYFPLDEAACPVRDATPVLAAPSTCSAQLGVAGVSDSAASFDGTSQRITVPYSSTMRLTGDFSVEFWAKLPAAPQTSGYPSLLSRGSGGAGHFGAALWVGSDAAHLVNFKRNGKNVPTARGLTTTAFRHLVFTWDSVGQRYTWYVDGTPDLSGVLPVLDGTDNETAPLSIGAFQDVANASPYSYGKVILDELAVYKTVLPASRVAAHYAASGLAAAPPPPPAVRRVGGIAIGDLQPWNTHRAADYDKYAAANATWIRTDIGWKYLEPSQGTFRWSLYDGVVDDIAARGMRYLAVLHTVPAWANNNGGESAAATNPSWEENYCYQVVKHYRPKGVVDYEIGNEVNYAHPGYTPTGSYYTRNFLLPCVRGARRAEAELGKSVNLMFGSLVPGTGVGGTEPLTFLTDAYAAGAVGQTDSLAFHPYGGLNPAVEPNMTTLPDKVRSIMAANGDGTNKMWATEYGLPTGGATSWSEAVQAEWIGPAFDTWAAHAYSGPMIWYAGRDDGTSLTDREDHFGVLRYDGSAKPAYATLQAKLTH